VQKFLVFLFAAILTGTPPPGTPGEISVPVWSEATGENASNPLTPKDVDAKLEGTPARVRMVLAPEDDLLLLLVTDMVDDLSLIAPAKQSLVSEIQKLADNVYVGLLQAQDGLRVLRDPGTDRAALSSSIEALSVSGRPGLLDTVETVADIADKILKKSAIRVAVLYVTDSNVREYREDFTNPVINSSDPHDLSRRFPEGLVREKISKIDGTLSVLQAPLFIVHLDYRSDRLNEAYQVGLQQLAATTGGTSIFCRSSAEIPDAIASMFQTILSYYRIDIELPAHPPKIIQVQLESDGRSLNYRPRFLLERR
jgi:hypothetical protein